MAEQSAFPEDSHLRGGVTLLSHSSIGKAATLGMNPCHPYLPPLQAVRCSLMTMHVAVCFVQRNLLPTFTVVADDHETQRSLDK